jgi:GxxExxY protein
VQTKTIRCGAVPAHGKHVLHAELSHRIVGGFYDVYTELGPGFLEAVYRRALTVRLAELGLEAREEVPLTIRYHGTVVGDYRADLIVEDTVILECKAGSAIAPGHQSQLLHYLKCTNLTLGIILNFGPKPSFKRLVRSIPAL